VQLPFGPRSSRGVAVLNKYVKALFEKAMAFFLFGTRQPTDIAPHDQRRAVVQRHRATSVPAEFNEKVVSLLPDQNATETFQFLLDYQF
jgi:hypothetical protein